MKGKRILFLTGTRADFGKLRPLLTALKNQGHHEVILFTTGMHMLKRYGSTWLEVEAAQLGQSYLFVNQSEHDSMDAILAKTISGLSDLVKETEPDLIVVHGDRVEALAGALVGTLNRCLVAHIEGGEVSGTVDEAIRHSVTKLAHLHFVSNEGAQNRLLQLGEDETTVFAIGSPEVDMMRAGQLPNIEEVLAYYEVPYRRYGIVLFHPVTTELGDIPRQARELVDALIASRRNWIVILPNNDDGTQYIQLEYARLLGLPNVRILPSMRFDSFLTTLKHADVILGNSSSGVREAGFFGVPAVNLGSRQSNRSRSRNVISQDIRCEGILESVEKATKMERIPESPFGDGRSVALFSEILNDPRTWQVSVQKTFVDRPLETVCGCSSAHDHSLNSQIPHSQ